MAKSNFHKLWDAAFDLPIDTTYGVRSIVTNLALVIDRLVRTKERR